jgi:hypothetical protein
MLVVASIILAVAVFTVAVLLLRQSQISARLRVRNVVLEHQTRLRDEEMHHLINARLPALMDSLYGHTAEVPGPRHAEFAGTAVEGDIERVIEMFAEFIGRAKERADESAKATLQAMMRGVQSLANEQQLALSGMQERHDNPDVLEDLLKIDHMNAQLGRRAQATAVLCGSWPGQQRSASPLTDVVRGATSRIRDYLRVHVNSQVNVAVVSRAVEPVVLAVAELLDNAARHSQPTTPVEVNFQQVHNGVAIMIDDAGVAMGEDELRRAAKLLDGRQSVDINQLGDPPQVGFAVVGVMSARYGFKVSADTRSPYGGVRAVVFLPTALLTRIEQAPRTVRDTRAPAPAATPARAPLQAEAPVTRGVTESGLPKRRRVSTTAQADAAESIPADEHSQVEVRPGTTGAPAPTTTPARPARTIAAGMGAWQRGTRSGRATNDSEGNPPA